MKIEPLIVQQLYNQKQVTLQGIGTLFLNPSVILPSEAEKDFVLPDNAFTFEYNLKAGEDEALVNFIIQQTKKMRPLAVSDLESFSMLAKQFLNLGKPLVIEGVGTLLKNQIGEYQFFPTNLVSHKIAELPFEIKEKSKDKSPVDTDHKNDNGKKVLFFLFISVVIVLSVLGAYYFISNNKSSEIEVIDESTEIIDTLKNKLPDTIAAVEKLPIVTMKKDSSNFKIVIKVYTSFKDVNRAFEKLTEWGHNVVIVKIDSTKYQLVMPFTTPLSDTVRAKDSLRIFFGGKPFILVE